MVFQNISSPLTHKYHQWLTLLRIHVVLVEQKLAAVCCLGELVQHISVHIIVK